MTDHELDCPNCGYTSPGLQSESERKDAEIDSLRAALDIALTALRKVAVTSDEVCAAIKPHS